MWLPVSVVVMVVVVVVWVESADLLASDELLQLTSMPAANTMAKAETQRRFKDVFFCINVGWFIQQNKTIQTFGKTRGNEGRIRSVQRVVKLQTPYYVQQSRF